MRQQSLISLYHGMQNLVQTHRLCTADTPSLVKCRPTFVSVIWLRGVHCPVYTFLNIFIQYKMFHII